MLGTSAPEPVGLARFSVVVTGRQTDFGSRVLYEKAHTKRWHRYTHSVHNLLLRDRPRCLLSVAPIREVPVQVAKITQKVEKQMNTYRHSRRSKPYRSE